jgi:Family of unknown function (DUF6596)
MRTRDAGIPFRIPEKEELPERLQAVLDAIYAAYSKGWNEVGEAGVPEIADEAIWLGRLVVSLMPDEPEAKGMLALMLYAEARRAARRDASGAYVPLEEQDATLWDDGQIAVAEGLLREASRSGPTGRYQLEAAIQSAHTARRLTGRSNWPVVVQLYDHLLALTGSPVVVLNRAVALAEIEGPEAALAAIEPAPTRACAVISPIGPPGDICWRASEQTRTPLRPIASPSGCRPTKQCGRIFAASSHRCSSVEAARVCPRVTYCPPRPDSAGRKNSLRLATLPRTRRSGFDGGLRQAKSGDGEIPTPSWRGQTAAEPSLRAFFVVACRPAPTGRGAP